jgi:hypothetical protein
MKTFEAIAILEMGEEGGQLEALASLIRSGIVWQLQGAYGRAAMAAIRSGLISKDGEILENNG